MAQQTKSPGDRYTDESHNPYSREADAIFNHPDMQALNDQGDAIIRDNEAKNNAEATEKKQAENAFNYQSGGAAKKTTNIGRVKAFFSNKRNVAITGGATGLFITAVFAILSLLPFKVPGLMQIVTDAAGQRVEHVTTERAKKIIAKAIFTKFGVHGVVLGNGPIDTLIKTLSTNRFEQKLAAKGLVIEEVGDDRVRLKMNGKDMGVFNDPDAIQRALDADQLTNKMIKDIVKEEIPSWRWMKRAKFANYLRLKYGIKRFGVEESKNKDSKTAARETEEARIKTVTEQQADVAVKAADCISKAECADVDLDSNNELKESPNGADTSGQSRDAITRATDKIIEEGVEGGAKLTLKAAMKAIPVIGWINLTADIYHLGGLITSEGAEDGAIKIPATFRGNSAAQIYGSWAGYGDQIKAGDMSPTYVGVLAGYMDGAETSRAYSCLNNTGCSSGVAVQDRINEDADTNSTSAQFVRESSQIWRNANAVQLAALDIWYRTIGTGGLSGMIEDAIGDVVGNVLNELVKALGGQSLLDWANETFSHFIDSVLQFMGLSIDPLAVGADLFNNIDMGGNVAYNSYCKDLGCRKLTTEQASAENRTIAQERSEELASMSWWDRAFSPEVNTSLTTQLAVALPSSLTPQAFDLTDGMSQLASLVSSSPANLVSSFTKPAGAVDQGYNNLYGIIPYGATKADLNLPLSDDDCTPLEAEARDGSKFDACNVDRTVAEAMTCNFAPNSDACNFSDAPLPGSGSSDDGSTAPGGGDDLSGDEASAQGFKWPIAKEDFPGTSNCYRKPGHTGVDIPVPVGTKVRAAKEGTVVEMGDGGDAGNYIIINHGEYWTNYQHLSKFEVTRGQTVTAGQVIARSGNTGFSTGAHLHFSVTNKLGLDSRRSVSYSLNPMKFLPDDRSSSCKG